MGLFQRLNDGLAKTRAKVRDSLDRLLKRGPDPASLEELEADLIAADLGVRTVDRLMERLRGQARGLRPALSGDPSPLIQVARETILEQLRGCEGEPIERLIAGGPKPFVVLSSASMVWGRPPRWPSWRNDSGSRVSLRCWWLPIRFAPPRSSNWKSGGHG